MSEVELPEGGIRNTRLGGPLGISRPWALGRGRQAPDDAGSTYFGGMFSGLLDQSDTQSALFFKASTSFSPSAASSSDCK